MTQEEKQLLLKDLCGRLPYGVKADIIKRIQDDSTLLKVQTVTPMWITAKFNSIEDVKPYLRPMSSMTEEEVEQYYEIRTGKGMTKKLGEIDAELFDFYHKNHIDYRGLIERGLALEAPEGMYKTE